MSRQASILTPVGKPQKARPHKGTSAFLEDVSNVVFQREILVVEEERMRKAN